jgi:hypothetical protein
MMTWQVIAFSCRAGQAEHMTTTTTASTIQSRAEATLRKALLANTGFSVVTGLIGLIFGGPVADALGVDQVWLIRLLSVGLLGFAGVVFLVANSSQPVLQRWSQEISLGDFGWVAGTIVVIALGWLSTSGAIIMAAVGLAVLGLGLAQFQFRRDMIAAAAA